MGLELAHLGTRLSQQKLQQELRRHNQRMSPGTLSPRSSTRRLRSLRAVRRFSDRSLPEDVVLDILETGRWTGSAKNTQPWRVVVVQDRAVLEQLSRLGQYAGHIAGAQAALALVMDGPQNAFDCGRLAENLMTAAWAHGVGSCIGSLFPDDNMTAAKTLLGIPEQRWVRHAISLGYPADESARLASSTPSTRSVLPSVGRKPLDEFASWEKLDRRTP